MGGVAASAAMAQDGPRIAPIGKQPAVFARGKLPASASGFPFESRAKALAGDVAQSDRHLSLDGQ